jgi:hypothetical protein
MFYLIMTHLFLALFARDSVFQPCEYPLLATSKILTTPFDLKDFLNELYHPDRIFLDKQGEAFRYVPSNPSKADDHTMNLNILHSRVGFIPMRPLSKQKKYTDFLITENGDINAFDALIDYQEHQNLGLLSPFFQWADHKIPHGSNFSLVDYSETNEIIKNIYYDIDNSNLKEWINSDYRLKKMYDFFNVFTEQKSFYTFSSPAQTHKIIDSTRSKSHPFLLYISDLSSSWGRIMRKGNWRSDYFSPYMRIINTRLFIHHQLSAEWIKRENQLIKDLAGPNNFKWILEVPRPYILYQGY